MRSICDAEGLRHASRADGVGGASACLSRSACSARAMCGINIDHCSTAPAAMDTRCSDPVRCEIPRPIIAFLLIELARRGKVNHVMMPYPTRCISSRIGSGSCGESLGKRYDKSKREVFAGATPIKALGTTDQTARCNCIAKDRMTRCSVSLRLSRSRAT